MSSKISTVTACAFSQAVVFVIIAFFGVQSVSSATIPSARRGLFFPVPTMECFQALDLRDQGYMWIHKDCSAPHNMILTRAFRYAYWILAASADFPSKQSHQEAAEYYMGPDWETDEYKHRITENVLRAVAFHSSKVNNYITITCEDERKQCGKKLNDKSVGGYAWSDQHYLWWNHHFIHMCPIFFTGVAELDAKLGEIREETGAGDYSKADDASWLQTTGSYLVHEMMHSKLISNSPPDPEITDEPVNPEDGKGKGAYMPYFVRMLAKRNPNQGGGARRASTNSDSYLQMMNAIYWNTVTGHLPRVPPTIKTEDDVEDPNNDIDPNILDTTAAANLPIIVSLGDMMGRDDYDAAFQAAGLVA